jgi:dTDP-4-dehydrorhamnose reductase
MRILILGATGMLGHKMWQRLGEQFAECYATIRSPRTAVARYGLYDDDRVIDQLDVMNFEAVLRVLDDVRPGVVVNCIAVTKRREESTEPILSIELNAAFPHKLAQWTCSKGARLIHFSTDCVFDGRTGNYDESSPTNAEDIYGRTKALGEVGSAGALTLRTSLVGREIKERTELLEWFLAQRGRSVRGYRRALYTGVSTLWMTDLVSEVIRHFPDLSGIHQIAAPMLSKYALLVHARDAFGVDVDIQPDDSFVMLRNLNGSRFSSLTGIRVPDWRTMMAGLAADPTPYDSWSALG